MKIYFVSVAVVLHMLTGIRVLAEDQNRSFPAVLGLTAQAVRTKMETVKGMRIDDDTSDAKAIYKVDDYLITLRFIDGRCGYVCYAYRGESSENAIKQQLSTIAPEVEWRKDQSSIRAELFAFAWRTADGTLLAYYNDRRKGDMRIAYSVIRNAEPTGLTLFSRDFQAALKNSNLEINWFQN